MRSMMRILPAGRWRPVRPLPRRLCRSSLETSTLAHTPVLLKEVLTFFEGSRLRVFLDCTLGFGGHSFQIIQQHPELECLVGVDLDAVALQHAQNHLDPILQLRPALKTHVLHGNFKDLPKMFMKKNPPLGHLLNEGIDGIIMDLGMSSLQLDDAERGFSFMRDGPLDMRMGNSTKLTAEEIVNTWSEFELGELFRNYGEESRWKQIASRICQAREQEPIKTSRQLVEVIGTGNLRTQKKRYKKPIHPATKVFQALRIAVNDELRSLEKILPTLMKSLSPEGILGVISFHSLEDRIVKSSFRESSVRLESAHINKHYLSSNVSSDDDTTANGKGQILTKRPVIATEEELENNPRSRSAKLRVFQNSVH